jgi:hypothetical protein
MGFLDKAKKMAEQAQAKLDETQKQFNESQRQDRPSGPPVEYDAHGRPIPQAPPAPGVPPTGQGDPVPPPEGPPVAQAGVAPTTEPSPAAGGEAPAPHAPPAAPQAGGVEEDRNHPSYEPPKLTSGDPLAG